MMSVVGRLGQNFGTARHDAQSQSSGTVTADVGAKPLNPPKAARSSSGSRRRASFMPASARRAFAEDALIEPMSRHSSRAINRAKPSGAKSIYMKRATLSSTMGAGIKLEPEAADPTLGSPSGRRDFGARRTRVERSERQRPRPSCPRPQVPIGAGNAPERPKWATGLHRRGNHRSARIVPLARHACDWLEPPGQASWRHVRFARRCSCVQSGHGFAWAALCRLVGLAHERRREVDRATKEQQVSSLRDTFNGATVVVVTHYLGITAGRGDRPSAPNARRRGELGSG